MKEIIPRNWGDILSLRDYSETGTQNQLVCKRTLNHLAKLANNWAALWGHISTVDFKVCSYHVAYEFQSESALYKFLNIKDLLDQNRRYS